MVEGLSLSPSTTQQGGWRGPPHPAGPTLVPLPPAGWLEDQPAVITDRMEIRPAAELGPIILCLDTSGSMSVSGCGECVESVDMCGVR